MPGYTRNDTSWMLRRGFLILELVVLAGALAAWHRGPRSLPQVNSALPEVSSSGPVPVVVAAEMTTNGTGTHSPTSYAYQWIYRHMLGNAAGSPSTASFYTPVGGDVGHPLRVTVTATNANGSTAATALATSAVSSGDLAFTALHTYFMSPTGSDSNSGADAGHPWKTPNHAGLVCGDVIIAATGDYSTSWAPRFSGGNGLDINVQPSSCPSSSGGVDGTGGIYFVTVLCAGNLGACAYTGSGNAGGYMVAIDNVSNWAIEGFQITSSAVGNNGMRGFITVANATSTTRVHHSAFVNDIVYHAQTAYSTDESALNHNIPGNGVDYYAVVGSIAQDAMNDGICLAAIDVVAPSPWDSVAGTHIFFYGNFAWNYEATCGTDVEPFMFDTPDAHGYTQQMVMLNNIGWLGYRYGIQVFIQDNNSIAGLHEYVINNTMYDNNQLNSIYRGDINVQNDNRAAPSLVFEDNVTQTAGNSCGLLEGGNYGPATLANVTLGARGHENVAMAPGEEGWSFRRFRFEDLRYLFVGNSVCVFNGGPPGANFTVNPNFANTVDLLSNRSSAPNCSSFTNVTACMGWNANTSTLVTPSVISDLTPNCSQCAGKGYQRPSTTCVTSGPVSTYYPTWLKGIVYLQWNGSTLIEKAGLVTKPCGF
jgi:hypothetical protein